MTNPPDTMDFIPTHHGESVLKDFFLTIGQPTGVASGPTATPGSPSDASGTLPPSGQRYRFQEEIARGGMGVVLRGRDEDLGREIAIKVLLTDGKSELLWRFLEEARIAGQLQHPGVTPVYELGCLPNHRPYFTMKLVRGETLAHLLRQRAEPTADRPRFLKIFEQVCQTLAYAHAQGVIHRDLKPANIMVGAFGEVQVMDWGLAKVLRPGELETRRPNAREATDAPSSDANFLAASLLASPPPEPGASAAEAHTQDGAVLGTPAYMAPEQARGNVDRVDERSDVFSLGAILCEILTGLPPFSGTSLLEVVSQAQLGDTGNALARLDRCLADPELVALARRCLSLDQEDRPRDAGVLTQELTAYLNAVDQRLRQAELATVTAQTRAVEETKRRRLTFRLAAGILLTLLTGLAASLWQMNRALTAEEQTAAALVQVTTERDQKEQARQAATQAQLLTQRRLEQIEKGTDLLAGIFSDLDLDQIHKANQKLEWVLGERLKKAAQELRGEQIGDPLTVARLQLVLGSSLLGLGHAAEAASLLSEARATQARLLGAEDPSTMATASTLAAAYQRTGRPDLAMPLLEATLRLQKDKLGPDHAATLTTMNNLAAVYQKADKTTLALPLLEELLGRWQAMRGPDDPETLLAMNNLASTYQRAGKIGLALPLLEETLRRRKAVLGPHHPETLISMHNLAAGYRAVGKLEQSLPLNEQTLRLMKATLGPDHPETLASMYNVARDYLAARKTDAAVSLYEETLQRMKAKLGPDHQDTLLVMNSLANSYQVVGKPSLALPLIEECLRRRQTILGPDHRDTYLSLNDLAAFHWKAGRFDRSVPLFEDLLQRQAATLGKDHPHTQITRANLGVNYKDSGRLAEALPLLEEAYQASRQQPALRWVGLQLLDGYVKAGKTDPTTVLAQELLAEARATLAPTSSQRAGTLTHIAQNLLAVQAWPLAETVLRECLRLREKQAPDGWAVFHTKAQLGQALLGQQKYAEAEPHLRDGYLGLKQRAQTIPPRGRHYLPETLDKLVQLYEALGKPEEAAKWRQEREVVKGVKQK